MVAGRSWSKRSASCRARLRWMPHSRNWPNWRRPAVPDEVSIDLADLHGFRYHTGATFAAYVTGLSGPLLRGGRYDDIGQAFGRARPATGFSLLDLREAAQLAAPCWVRAIRAPRAADPKLDAIVEALRARGEVVIRADAVGELGVALTVDRELVWDNGTWSVRELPCAPGVKMDQPG